MVERLENHRSQTQQLNDVVYHLYKKDFHAGDTIILGTNGQAAGCVQYSVIAIQKSNDSIKGDVNHDGEFTITDIILLQKWLLAVPGVVLYNWESADFDENGTIDVLDLSLMKREYIGLL